MVAIADARLLHNFPPLEFPARHWDACTHASIVYTLPLARASPPTYSRPCMCLSLRAGAPRVNKAQATCFCVLGKQFFILLIMCNALLDLALVVLMTYCILQ